MLRDFEIRAEKKLIRNTYFMLRFNGGMLGSTLSARLRRPLRFRGSRQANETRARRTAGVCPPCETRMLPGRLTPAAVSQSISELLGAEGERQPHLPRVQTPLTTCSRQRAANTRADGVLPVGKRVLPAVPSACLSHGPRSRGGTAEKLTYEN